MRGGCDVTILKAINLDPTIQSSFSNKAQALIRLTTHKAAQAALEDASRFIELNPDFIEGYERKCEYTIVCH
jgi:hypothetical protein